MKMKHMIIEGFCEGYDNYNSVLPCNNSFLMGIECFKCSLFSYTFCENEIAYSNNYGIVEKVSDFIGFGGNMQIDENKNKCIDIWSKICRQKIIEAYKEYMKQIEK